MLGLIIDVEGLDMVLLPRDSVPIEDVMETSPNAVICDGYVVYEPMEDTVGCVNIDIDAPGEENCCVTGCVSSGDSKSSSSYPSTSCSKFSQFNSFS